MPRCLMLPFESFSYPFFDLNYRTDHRALAASFLSTTDDSTSGLKALYVHVPFCDTICTFCPFAKSVGTPERIAAYLRALHAEMKTLGVTERIGGWELDSVYVGGGTPSVLSEDQLAELFAAVRANFRVKADAEVSFEFEAKSMPEA